MKWLLKIVFFFFPPKVQKRKVLVDRIRKELTKDNMWLEEGSCKSGKN